MEEEAVEEEVLVEGVWDEDRLVMGCRVGIGREAKDYQKKEVVDGGGAEARFS
jgi:hypothetical protein